MTFQVEFATQPKVLNVEFDTALNISGGYDDGYNDGFSQGKSEGLTEGEEIGYGKGEAIGYKNGLTEGDAKGYERGYTEGEDKGYASGYTEGDTVGYNRGYNEGETEGYSNGYNKGVEDTTPSGEIELTQNGTHDVAKYATAKVNVGGFTMQDFVDGRGTFYYLYYNAQKLSDVSWLASVDTSKITSLNNAFYSCYSLTDIPLFDTSNVTEWRYAFNDCRGLIQAPALNTSKGKNFSNIFRGCTALISVPQYDMKSATDLSYMFGYCTKLTSVPSFLNTQLVTDTSNMFYYDQVFTTVGCLDMRSVTSANNMFTYCKALANLALKNIKTNLQVGSGTSYGHLLTLESLIGLCYELRDTGANKTLTMGSANLEKLANVYVREIPITDAMREADDLIDEKLPFERCESTADGATLITDYVLLKNWKLA